METRSELSHELSSIEFEFSKLKNLEKSYASLQQEYRSNKRKMSDMQSELDQLRQDVSVIARVLVEMKRAAATSLNTSPKKSVSTYAYSAFDDK